MIPKQSLPLSYTSAPWKLVLSDLLLWIRITFVWPLQDGILSIVLPVLPLRSGKLDELYPSPGNLWAIAYHLVALILQGGFLLSLIPAAVSGFGVPFLPPFVGAYTAGWFLWVVGFVVINYYASYLVNGFHKSGIFVSKVHITPDERQKFARERWIFVNGVAAGEHWIQAALDRMSLTFRREIYGIQNPTHGVFFDLIECVLERTLSYSTASTREVYAKLLDNVSNPDYDRVVLILHSQGAIMGSLAVDWLLNTLPYDQVAKLEVYTFGSAANHFNNPVYSKVDNEGRPMIGEEAQSLRVLSHIEHYANSGDYVSKFGVLAFRPIPGRKKRHLDPTEITDIKKAENRYFGRLFIRNGTGHQLNGNYFDNFFRMDPKLQYVEDSNPFMDSSVDLALKDDCNIIVSKDDKIDTDVIKSPTIVHHLVKSIQKPLKVKDVSRLWLYRNGGVPNDRTTGSRQLS